MKKIMQFELWHECNTKCKFCYLWQCTDHTPDHRKLSALQKCLDKISDLSIYEQFDTLGFMGGEFFQGQLRDPEVKSKFYEVMVKTAELYNQGLIRQVWISATLAIGPCTDLYEILKLFKDHKEVWILTSWDTLGRFHSPKMLNTWEQHMERLHSEYPDLKINCTTILTGDLIDRYNRGEISFQKMSNRYGCSFFFKQCGALFDDTHTRDRHEAKRMTNEKLPNFFPRRSEFLKFLARFKEQEGDEFYARLFDVHLRADEWYRNYNDEESGQMQLTKRNKESKVESEGVELLKCGHIVVYNGYIDSDACCICDKEMIGKLF